jgi:hypothetical protein
MGVTVIARPMDSIFDRKNQPAFSEWVAAFVLEK